MIELPDGTKAVNWSSRAGASTFLACFMRKMILAVESQDEEDFNRRLQSAVLSRVLKITEYMSEARLSKNIFKDKYLFLKLSKTPEYNSQSLPWILFYCHEGLFFPKECSLKLRLKTAADQLEAFSEDLKKIAFEVLSKKLQDMVKNKC